MPNEHITTAYLLDPIHDMGVGPSTICTVEYKN